MSNLYEGYYQENEGYEVGLYAYSPPPDGVFKFDGVKFDSGKDYRTVENYVIYKECGFTIFFGQLTAKYNGVEAWEESVAKKVLDKVRQAGIQKAIIVDGRLHKLSREKESIIGRAFSEDTESVIGKGRRFADEKELDAYVAACMKDYVKHPIFYGVQLVDEPRRPQLKAVGEVYRSIKRVCPQAFVQCNLNPPNFVLASNAFPYDGDFSQRYKAFVNEYLDETGSDYFLNDIYPIIPDENGTIYKMYIRGLQICAEIAQERGVQFRNVLQSTYWTTNNVKNWRALRREDMFYQINALVGFGVKEFAYFTYWNKTDNDYNSLYFADGQAIVRRNGEKAPLYDHVKEVNGMLQKLMPVVSNFDYVADAHNATWPTKSRPMFLLPLSCKPLKNVVFFKPDKEVVLVSEMYDKKKDRYLYRLMNASDPYYGNELGVQTTEIQFDKKFRFADVFTDGEWKTVELIDGKYVAKLMPGFADYLLIY